MLEDVFDFGKRGLFVEKLFALERGQQPIEFVFGLGDDLPDRLNGNSRPMTESCCSRAFSSGASRSMRAARIACTVEGICSVAVDGAVTADRPYLGPDQHALFE